MHGRKEYLIKIDADDTRPHDWIEADMMMLPLPYDAPTSLHGRDDVLPFVQELHESFGDMYAGNMPFTDDNFRKTLENALKAFSDPRHLQQVISNPNGIIATVLSEEVNDHPIDHFQELLACMRMHPMHDALRDMNPVWHAHELMKRHRIAEYDDTGSTFTFVGDIALRTDSDDEIIMKAKLFDAIMRACGDDANVRGGMRRLAFTAADWMDTEDITNMLKAIRSYSASEPDYHAALSVFDDYMAKGGFFSRFSSQYRNDHDRIDQGTFRRLLKSCDGNPNAMSGFMHAAIGLYGAADCNKSLADLLSSFWTRWIYYYIICPTSVMRLMLANLAEGYPIEYIIELIISENDPSQRQDMPKLSLLRRMCYHCPHERR